MTKHQSTGTCRYCGESLKKAAMTKHLKGCTKRVASISSVKKGKTGTRRFFHILAEGQHNTAYWMHIEISSDKTLHHLDGFLRDTWLECCGHMSAFEIGNERFASEPDREYGEKGMRSALHTLLAPDMKFCHEYDYGSTTELKLRVLSEREGPVGKAEVVLMAQNDPPEIQCSSCGKIATLICSCCNDEESGYSCATCAEDHECGEDMLLPLVNSPRTGVCGYTG